jgi:hypothetical protein
MIKKHFNKIADEDQANGYIKISLQVTVHPELIFKQQS